MADEKTTQTGKDAPNAPAKAASKSYVVAFSGIRDKRGTLRLKGETITEDELPDPAFQLEIGAIEEPAPVKPAKAPKGPKDEKPTEK